MKKIFEIDSFKQIPENYMYDLQQIFTVLDCPKGKLLYSPGDKITSVFIVLAGQFISYRLTPKGKQCTTRAIPYGEFIGEEDYFSGNVRETFVESTTNSKYLSIPTADYEKLLLTFPAFSRQRLKKLCKRLKDTELTMQEIAYSSVKQRLLLILTKLGRQIGTENPDKIVFSMNWTHHELAYMIGATRESISHTFSLLQHEGVLKVDNKILHIDKEKLKNFLDTN